MYGVQKRIYCGVCQKFVLPDNYPIHLRSQRHASNVMRNQCTNSMIRKTHYKKKYMKTELVNIIANEAIYQLQYYNNSYLTHKKINEKFLIIFTTLIICLLAFLVYYYLKT